MTSHPVVLGIDLATSAARVLAIDAADGRLLGFVGGNLPAPVRSAADGSRQRPDYAAVVGDLIGQTVRTLGERAGDIAALTVTGTSGTVVPCDSSGRPVDLAVLYNDHSAVGAAETLQQNGFDCGRGSVPARMGMLRATTDARMLLHTPDVVLAALAGRVLPADTSHALKSGIDPVTGQWPEQLLTAVGIPPSMLPPLTAPGLVIGEVSASVAAQLGLPTLVLLVSGMTDGCTAQIACGAVHLGDTVGVLGTTLVLKAVATDRIVSLDGSIYSHYAPDGSWWPGAASNVGAAALAGSSDGRLRIAELPALDAAAAEHGPSSMLRYPLVGTGERFPVADPTFRGWQIGEPDSVADSYRSILEGVAFVERHGLEQLAARGVQRRRHLLTGGAAKSTIWNRIRAGVLGETVYAPPAGGSGNGAAALATSALLGMPLRAVVDRWAHHSEPVDPDPAESEQLQSSYRRWSEELARRTDSCVVHQ
ncbi:MAG: FGGY-family carbohydrate kinase [Actinomycetota bacterium]|nr:FGGY-family carbohydrate kinase [Actinomycetota bacterium]